MKTIKGLLEDGDPIIKTIKGLLEDGDPIIQDLTDKFIDDKLTWDEFYTLCKKRLKETGDDSSFDKDYDRAMKGI